MRSWIFFVAGGLLGLTAGVTLKVGSSDRSGVGSAPDEPGQSALAAATASHPGLPERRSEAPTRPRQNSSLSPEIYERIEQATRKAAPPPSARERANPELMRLENWLAENAFSEAQQEEITARYLTALSGSSADPFIMGSTFDEWMREELDQPDLSKWEDLQGKHKEELVERRTNVLFAGLQQALALNAAQKDALYQEIANTVREDLPQMNEGTLPSGQGFSEMVATQLDRLAAHIPEDQHAALESWLADELPALWLGELPGEPTPPDR